MGSFFSHAFVQGYKPPEMPLYNETPSFPPDFGFSAPRKIRESKYTPEELKVLNIPQKRKDYCADTVVEYVKCMRKFSYFSIFCQCERHAINQCRYEDEILRMKEYEREKRLRIRQMKIEKLKAEAAN